jgi:hypothetical protein
MGDPELQTWRLLFLSFAFTLPLLKFTFHAFPGRSSSSPLAGEDGGGGRVAILQRSPNHLFDRHRILQDLCIPEPQNPEAFSFQPRGPLRIIFRLFCVLSAVHLDDQPLLQTDEVDDVRPQGLLAPKLVPTELPQT